MKKWSGLSQRLEGEIVVLEPLGPQHEAGLRAAAAEEGREAPFAVRLRETDEIVGTSRYMNLRPEHKGLEIGYTWNTPAVWRRGVNVEGKYLLLRHAFEDVGCMRVEFKTDARNERARAALEALPARFEGIFLKHMLVRDDVVRDSAWYAITDAEWPAVRANLERRINEKR